MSNGPYPQSRSTADIWISIILLVVAAVGWAFGSFISVFLLAFLDNCPPETCSAAGVAISVWGGVGVAALVLLAGGIITVVLLVRGKIAWPWAVGTLVLCGVVLTVGVVGFLAAAG